MHQTQRVPSEVAEPADVAGFRRDGNRRPPCPGRMLVNEFVSQRAFGKVEEHDDELLQFCIRGIYVTGTQDRRTLGVRLQCRRAMLRGLSLNEPVNTIAAMFLEIT